MIVNVDTPPWSLSNTSWALLLPGALASLCLFYGFAQAIYNVYFHPLAKFPGPKAYAATFIPFYYAIATGQVPFVAKRIHDQYGPVVRIRPDMLYFTTSGGWKEIYGHRKAKPQLPKDPHFFARPETSSDIIMSSDSDHARMRRLLAHAFSDKALQEQQPLIMTYVDLLIQKLRVQPTGSDNARIVNIVHWYNLTTFDIIGDLAFGKSFGGLQQGAYHFYVSNIFDSIRASRWLQIMKGYPLMEASAQLLLKISGASVSAKRDLHYKFSKDVMQERLDKETDRKDFISYITKYNDEKGMSQKEIASTSGVLLVAGSETTASLLSGTTFLLLKNQLVLQKLVDEIRSAFHDEGEIDLTSAARLPYLHAVLEESLRVYPPVPSAIPRMTLDGGEVIDGHFVPGNTKVGVPQWSTYQSSLNFREPDKFIPERWLGDERFAADDKSAFQPFSTGPRNCIGKNLAYAEMRTIMARILFTFDMTLCEDSTNWNVQRVFNIWEKPALNIALKEREM